MNRGTTFASLAPVTTLFMTLNIFLYLIEVMNSKGFTIDGRVLMVMGASWREGLWDGEWIRLIAPSFLHVHFLHILLNTLSLRSLGPMCEIHFGSSNFGTLYILCGVTGFCFSQIFGAELAAGASASIFGLIGAILAARIIAVPVLKNFWRNKDVKETALWAAIYLMIGVGGLMGIVSNWAHLGGFLGGLLLGCFFDFWRKQRRISLFAIIGVFVLIGSLIAAARWSIFNPYYHMHQGLLAEESGSPVDAQPHFSEALTWAQRWGQEQKIRRLINQHKLGRWTIQDARQAGYSRLDSVIEVRDIEDQVRLLETGSTSGERPPAGTVPEADKNEPKKAPNEEKSGVQND